MTDSTPPPSPIQRRMTLTRARNLAILTTVGMAFVLSTIITRLTGAVGDAIWLWIGVVVFAILLLASIASIVRAVRAIRVFEAKNGRDAGRQKPVGRP